jgi:hypothetical protein
MSNEAQNGNLAKPMLGAVNPSEKGYYLTKTENDKWVIKSVGTKENNLTPITYQYVYGVDKKEAVFIAVSKFAKLYNNKEI